MFSVFIRRASILGFSATGEEDGGEKKKIHLLNCENWTF